MMKYIFVPHIEEIPEWKQCYYDKETLSKLVKLCDLCHNLIRAARRNLRVEETTLHSMKKSHKQIEAYSRIERISRYEFILRRIIEQANKKFHEYSDSQIRTLYLFAQMKSFQLKQKVANLKVYNLAIERGDKDLAVFIENGFIEAHYLKRMIQYNRAQQSIVQRQYQLHHQELQISQIHPLAKRLDRVQNFVENIAEEFENLYKTNTVNSQEQVMREVINYSDEGQARNPKQSYSLFFSMGIVIICLAALLFFKSYHKIDIQTNKVYQSDFPIWRGASYLVAYQWILGFSLMFLEKTQINYKLILNLEGLCLPKSRSFLFDAQVTTIVFLSLFLLYMLEMAKVINTGFRHFGHIMWLVEIIYFLVPLPFTYRQGKIYFLKLLATVILSPFPFIKSSILIIWISQQIVSFSQPIVDFTYAVCKLNDMSSKCDNTPDINLGILVTIFTYRMIQNLKVLNQNNFCLIPPFYGVFRAFSSMLTAITSYVYRKQLTDTAFGFFCTVAFITTCIAIFVDLKADWGLFQDKILRKNLFFVNQKYFYYICIVIDVILRCNWVLNISPSFVNNLGILPFYLIMIVSYLELLRRGMWNIFRIESIHVQNCSTFKATIDDKPVQNRIRDKCLKYIDNKNEAANKQIEQMNTIRQKSQMELVLQNLRDRDDYKYEIQSFLEIQMKQVKQIQAQIQAKLTA